MKPVATIILNRNLPGPTDQLVEHVNKYDSDVTDVYVIEAGSDDDRLSKYCTWHVKSDDVRKNGMRYSRGMNFGLNQLYQDGTFKNYEAFFLLTNDTELQDASSLKPLMNIFEEHPRVGILSPCSKQWGESLLLQKETTKYFWFIHNNAYLLRREFVESVCERKDPGTMNFLFDGDNFRGYGSESELIAKGYANDWAAAITSEVWAEENQSYLLDKADLIKTDSYDENMKLFVEQGLDWMHRKYGFNSRWSMNLYVKAFYDSFFDFHPEYSKFRI
jgi:hypothetical protein